MEVWRTRLKVSHDERRVQGTSYKEASQTRDYCVAKNASRGSPRSLAAQKTLARDDNQTVLDIALLAASVHVHQRESCAAAAIVRFNGDHVLVVLGPDFEFGYRAGVVAFTLHLF